MLAERFMISNWYLQSSEKGPCSYSSTAMCQLGNLCDLSVSLFSLLTLQKTIISFFLPALFLFAVSKLKQHAVLSDKYDGGKGEAAGVHSQE